MANREYKRKILAIIAIVTISVFTIVNGAMYIKTMAEHRFVEHEARMVDSAFNWYLTLYTENYNRAIESNDRIIKNVEKDIVTGYGEDKIRLQSDLMNIQNGGTRLNQILSDNIQDVVLNDLQDRRDNNDPFWATKEFIIADFSMNCSSLGDFRSFDNEIKLHDNEKLAKLALNKLNKQSTEQPIFWQFETSDYDINLQTMDFKAMKILLKNYKNDLNIFHNIEFLVPTYVYYDRDLLGNKIIVDGIQQTNTYQLILVQGFNVNDYMNSVPLYKSAKDVYKAEMDKLYKDYKLYNLISNIIIMLCIIVEGVLIILSAIIYNRNFSKD